MSLHVIVALEKEFGKPAFTNLSCEVCQVLVHPGAIPPPCSGVGTAPGNPVDSTGAV